MGGKVLPLPSDAWWEASERVHAEGLQQGSQQGLQAQHQMLVKNIENAMQNLHIDLETACKGLGTIVEEYEAAKGALQTALRRTIQQLMQIEVTQCYAKSDTHIYGCTSLFDGKTHMSSQKSGKITGNKNSC